MSESKCIHMTAEKEDTRLFSVWGGGVDIGEADHVATAKRMAQAHSNVLQHTHKKELKTDG